MFRQYTRTFLFRPSFSTIPLATIACLVGLSAAAPARAQVGDRASGPGVVVCPGGCYGGAHPFGCRGYGGPGYYGFFRRYWAYGFYGPNYHVFDGSGLVDYHSGFAMVYSPSGSGPGIVPIPPAPSESAAAGRGAGAPAEKAPAGKAPAEKAPAPDNAAHLLLIVPENAEVTFNGEKTRRTGPEREFVSPRLAPGQSFTYEVVVRSTDAKGKAVTNKRTLRVRANDRYRVDFTRPGPEGLPPPKEKGAPKGA